MYSAVSTFSSPSSIPAPIARTAHFHGVEHSFIDNWARLAESIGMDEGLGRIHAALYLGSSACSVDSLAEQLGLDVDECGRHLDTLVAFGGAHVETDDDGETVYVAEHDPWSWFMRTIRERARREFSPLLQSIRAVNTLAQEAKAASTLRVDPERAARIERIGKFTSFVDQISGLVETFATLGAGPLAATMRMASRFMR